MNGRPFALAAGLLVAPIASATSPVGRWTGKMQVQPPTHTVSLSPEQKVAMLKSMAAINKGRMFLTIRADHTYAMRTVGLPSDPSEKGTWSQKGNTVTLVNKKTGEKPQFTMAASGKTMSMVYPDGLGRITFSR